MKTKTARRWAAMLGALMLVAACGGGSEGSTTTGPASTEPTTTDAPATTAAPATTTAGETYKLGLMYSPVKWASLRVTEGTSFRAPALYEQYQGATSGFLSQAIDPCNNYGAVQATNPTRFANCAAELPGLPNFQQNNSVRVLSEGGAAAGLEAETSKNITFGLILQPSLGDAGGLSLAVDYFDIKIDNGVDQPGAQRTCRRVRPVFQAFL